MLHEYKDSLKEPFTVRIAASPETVHYVLKETADRPQGDAGLRFHLEDIEHKYGPALSLRVTSPTGNGAIGSIFLLPSTDNGTLLRVPPGRGSKNSVRSFEHDPNGDVFAHYLTTALEKMERLGFISGRSRFTSTGGPDVEASSMEAVFPSVLTIIDQQVMGVNVLISHGGRSEARDKLERFIRALGSNPFIVEEQPGASKHPDKKVDEALGKCDFAVILATKDRASQQDNKVYPRLNIIDEIARVREALNDRFIILLEKGLELPSNQTNVTWTSFTQGNMDEAFIQLVTELKGHGILSTFKPSTESDTE